MFAVALVVPLLSTYYKSAGITAGSLELMSTLFSGSQIMGGMAIGIANDAGILSKVRSEIVKRRQGRGRGWDPTFQLNYIIR